MRRRGAAPILAIGHSSRLAAMVHASHCEDMAVWRRSRQAPRHRIDASRSQAANRLVGENVLSAPAGEVEPGPRRQEGEAGLGQRPPALAVEPAVELLA